MLGNLDRKKAPTSFYSIFIAALIFWMVLISISINLYITKVPLKNIIRQTVIISKNIYKIEAQRPFGLSSYENNKRRLLKDYLSLSLRPILPIPKNHKITRILNFTVKSNDYQEIPFLFWDIFVEQQYFFETKIRDPFIVDCGSHIGISILYFKALYPSAKILGFEPDPNNLQILKENMARNGVNGVELVNKALSNIDGRMQFFGGNSVGSSLLEERGGKDIVEVETTRLSRYINQKVDFLKIDIEGGEQLVLEDLAAENKLRKIDQMVIEYHHHIKAGDDAFSRFLKILEDSNFGYQIETIPQGPYKKMSFEDIMIYAYQK